MSLKITWPRYHPIKRSAQKHWSKIPKLNSEANSFFRCRQMKLGACMYCFQHMSAVVLILKVCHSKKSSWIILYWYAFIFSGVRNVIWMEFCNAINIQSRIHLFLMKLFKNITFAVKRPNVKNLLKKSTGNFTEKNHWILLKAKFLS